MSFDYWHMKLTGGYVHHNGKIKTIDEMEFDEDKWEQDKPKGRFPEDYLPYIKFHLSDGCQVAYEDFEIKFPDDQWYLTKKKKASLLQRKMTRQYKIAPTSELYEVMHEEPMGIILDTCENMEYNPPTDMFNWTQEDKVFSKRLSLVRTGHAKRVLFYNSTPIGTMTRGKDWIQLTSTVSSIPKQVKDWWGAQLNTHVDAPIDESAPLGADLSNKQYAWHRHMREAVSYEGSHVYVPYREVETPHLLFILGDRKYAIARCEEVDLIYCDALISRAERQDMIQIFDEEIGDAA